MYALGSKTIMLAWEDDPKPQRTGLFPLLRQRASPLISTLPATQQSGSTCMVVNIPPGGVAERWAPTKGSGFAQPSCG